MPMAETKGYTFLWLILFGTRNSEHAIQHFCKPLEYFDPALHTRLKCSTNITCHYFKFIIISDSFFFKIRNLLLIKSEVGYRNNRNTKLLYEHKHKLYTNGGCWCVKESDSNLLCSTNIIWCRRSGPTVVQVMAGCLVAPSHYLKQCQLISEVQCQSREGNFTRYTSAFNHCI